MFQNQVYGITVLDPKHGPAAQGTQKMRDRAALAPAPLTPPHISFIHTTLALSEEGPWLPLGHLPVPPLSRHRPHPGPSLLPSPHLNSSPPSWKRAPSFPAIPDCSAP